MFFRRYGTFAGGINLPDEKHLTLDSPIEGYIPESPLRVPLIMSGSVPCSPLVQLGTRVEPAQRIAEASDPDG
ncbi:unnamed protein product, partial [marine sediment metagenome]